MVRIAHSAVFFVGGELPRTTHKIAQMTFELCRRHAERGSIIFINDLKSGDATLRGHADRERTFVVSEAPCDCTLLQKLDYFGGSRTIVDVNLDDGKLCNHHGTESVLKLINYVPILRLTDRVGGKDHNSRVLWVMRSLKDLNQPPIPATIIDKVLTTTANRRSRPTPSQ